MSLGRRLTSNVVGTLRFITAFNSHGFFQNPVMVTPLTCIIGSTACYKKTRLSLSAKCSYPNASFGVSYIYPIAHGVRAKYHATVSSFFGLMSGVYCIKRLSRSFYVGLGISCSGILGTSLNVRWANGILALYLRYNYTLW